MKNSAFSKTLQHTTLRASIGGALVLLLAFVAIFVLDPKATSLPIQYVIMCCLIVALLPIYPTYRLVAGRSTLQSWARRFFWATIIPWAAIIGHFAAYIPQYLPILFLLFVGGGGVGVGLMPRWSYPANTSFMVLLFLVSTYFINPQVFSPITPMIPLSCVCVLIASNWIGRTSAYYLKRNEEAAQLLRGSRRDKRLIAEERQKSDRLLLNILPESIAGELKASGTSPPVYFESATVLFTDFQGFTIIAEQLGPEELVRELDNCFSYFDAVVERYQLEKLKTIGDSYMCAGGVPVQNQTHAVDSVLAALEIQSFMNGMKEIKASQGFPYWELRLGIHCGPLVAGVIGEKKFAYDIWGDTVNTASRCESAGEAGRINISSAVYQRVSDFFVCTYRGKVPAKHKGEIEMYFVDGIRPELSRDGDGKVPNEEFQKLYRDISER